MEHIFVNVYYFSAAATAFLVVGIWLVTDFARLATLITGRVGAYYAIITTRTIRVWIALAIRSTQLTTGAVVITIAVAKAAFRRNS